MGDLARDDITEPFLDLLVAAGVPAAIVAVLATILAVVQFAIRLEAQAYSAEMGMITLFSRSSRRVRAAGIFSISHSAATAATVVLAHQILADHKVNEALGGETAPTLLKVQAGAAAFFLLTGWWSFKFGDGLPHLLGGLLTYMLSAGVLAFGAYQAVDAEDWSKFVPWLIGVYVWYRSVGWAITSESGLARAIQNP